MTRLLAFLLATSLLVGLSPSPARACSCIAPDAAELLATSEFAFVGSIVDMQPLGRGQFGGEALFTFQVRGWAKGNLGESVQVRSADNGAACGFELAPGQEAAIFVNKVDGSLSGGLCSTMDAASLEAVTDLADPIATDPTPPPDDAPQAVELNLPLPISTLVAMGGSAIAAALGAFWWVRRRNRPVAAPSEPTPEA